VVARTGDSQGWRAGRLHEINGPEAAGEGIAATSQRPAGFGLADGAGDGVNAAGAGAATAVRREPVNVQQRRRSKMNVKTLQTLERRGGYYSITQWGGSESCRSAGGHRGGECLRGGPGSYGAALVVSFHSAQGSIFGVQISNFTGSFKNA